MKARSPQKYQYAATNRTTPLGVIALGSRIGLLIAHPTSKNIFHFQWSEDGINFFLDKKFVAFRKGLRKHEHSQCEHFHFTHAGKRHVATYLRTVGDEIYRVVAMSEDLYDWQVVSETLVTGHEAVITALPKKKNTFTIYEGGTFVRSSVSTDLVSWRSSDRLLFTSRLGQFDAGEIELLGSFPVEQGLALIYETRSKVNSSRPTELISVGAVIFSHEHPHQIIWRSEDALWQAKIRTDEHGIATPIGIVPLGHELFAYWALHTSDGMSDILIGRIPIIGNAPKAPRADRVLLKRHIDNPIMEPHPQNEWETDAVLNPAALYHDGKVHLLYRAMGRDGISVVGYASSKDGYKLDYRSEDPVYEAVHGLDIPSKKKMKGPFSYNPSVYTSGGGWCGCEDPRAVKIGKRIYMSYLAFGGWDSVRMAVTSISEKDFENENWKWKKPVLISPAGEVHKNWVLFPEKIKGKFAVLHSISPEIKIDYVSSLDDVEDGKTKIKSNAPRGGRSNYWDNRVRGAGPPPIRTDIGWLLLYHAADGWDPNKYKLGAMILDLENPTKVLYRSSHPILCPEMWYENEGKPGVVYASGAVVKNGELIVYYGGGDRVVCVASVELKEFLNDLIKDVPIPLNFHKGTYQK